jgi:hypothetical protein
MISYDLLFEIVMQKYTQLFYGYSSLYSFNSGKSHLYESFTFVSLQFIGTVVLPCNSTQDVKECQLWIDFIFSRLQTPGAKVKCVGCIIIISVRG